MVVRLETTRCQLAVVRLRPRGQREKPPEERVIAGFFALLEAGRGVSRGFDIRVPVVPSGMAGNELVTELDTQPIGLGFQRQGVAGVLRGDGRAVGLDGNAKVPGGADLGHGGDSERVERPGTQRRPLGVP
jgi:hypothetical protein